MLDAPDISRAERVELERPAKPSCPPPWWNRIGQIDNRTWPVADGLAAATIAWPIGSLSVDVVVATLLSASQ